MRKILTCNYLSGPVINGDFKAASYELYSISDYFRGRQKLVGEFGFVAAPTEG